MGSICLRLETDLQGNRAFRRYKESLTLGDGHDFDCP